MNKKTLHVDRRLMWFGLFGWTIPTGLIVSFLLVRLHADRITSLAATALVFFVTLPPLLFAALSSVEVTPEIKHGE